MKNCKIDIGDIIYLNINSIPETNGILIQIYASMYSPRLTYKLTDDLSKDFYWYTD